MRQAMNFSCVSSFVQFSLSAIGWNIRSREQFIRYRTIITACIQVGCEFTDCVDRDFGSDQPFDCASGQTPRYE